MYTTYAQYGEARLKLTWTPTRTLPPLELITSISGFCFWQGQVVLVDLKQRGWDIPGGHPEPGESPEECFRRECLEEAYIRGGECTLLGNCAVDHSENPLWQPRGKYPLVGYQLCYRMQVVELLPFAGEYESAGRLCVAPAEVPGLMRSWNEILRLVLEEALAAGRR